MQAIIAQLRDRLIDFDAEKEEDNSEETKDLEKEARKQIKEDKLKYRLRQLADMDEYVYK